MNFLIDENVPKRIMKILRDKGYNITRVPSSAFNHDILKIANRENRIIITADSDFIYSIPKEYKSVKRIVFTFLEPDWKSAINFFNQNIDRILQALSITPLVIIKQKGKYIDIKEGIIFEF